MSTSTPLRFEFKKPAAPTPTKERVTERDPNLVQNWYFKATNALQPRFYIKFNSVKEAQTMAAQLNEALPTETSALVYTVQHGKDELRLSNTVFAPLAVEELRSTVEGMLTPPRRLAPIGRLELAPVPCHMQIDRYNDDLVEASGTAFRPCAKFLLGANFLNGELDEDRQVAKFHAHTYNCDYWVESLKHLCNIKGFTFAVNTHACGAPLPHALLESLADHVRIDEYAAEKALNRLPMIQGHVRMHHRRRTMSVLHAFRAMGADDETLRVDATRLSLDDEYYHDWVVSQAWRAPGMCVIGACEEFCPGGVLRYAEHSGEPCRWCMSHLDLWSTPIGVAFQWPPGY